MSVTCQHVLKEWAVVVAALARGEQILLFRKGGIAEPGGSFDIPTQRFWLLPGYEHQKAELLKPEYRDRLTGPGAAPPAGQLLIQHYAELVADVALTELERAHQLVDQHIWSPDFVEQRFHWHEGEPLHVLILRVFSLPHPHHIPDAPAYAGCKSWVLLDRPWPTQGAQAAVDETAFTQRVQVIKDRLALLGR